MKRIVVVLVLIVGLAVVAFASLNNSSGKNKGKQEVKKDMKEKKKMCKHTCPFS